MMPLATRDVRQFHVVLLSVCTLTALSGFILSYGFPDLWTAAVIINSEGRGWGLAAIEREGGLRMTGTLLDPVTFGAISAFGAVFGINLVQGIRNWRKELIVIAMIFLCLSAAILSLSRGAWLQVVVGFLLTLSLSKDRWLFLRPVMVGIVLGGIVLVFTLVFSDKDLRDQMREGTVLISQTWEKTVREGNIQRETMWAETLDGFRRHPMGYGLGQVGHAGERFKEEISSNAPEITDGGYLKILAEGGILLLVSFIFFQAIAIKQLLGKIFRSHGDNLRPFRVSVLCIFLGASLQMIASNISDLFFVSHLLWFLIGLGTRNYYPMEGNA